MWHAHAQTGAYERITEVSDYIVNVLQDKTLNVMA